jgi:hypothetical protein
VFDPKGGNIFPKQKDRNHYFSIIVKTILKTNGRSFLWKFAKGGEIWPSKKCQKLFYALKNIGHEFSHKGEKFSKQNFEEKCLIWKIKKKNGCTKMVQNVKFIHTLKLASSILYSWVYMFSKLIYKLVVYICFGCVGINHKKWGDWKRHEPKIHFYVYFGVW